MQKFWLVLSVLLISIASSDFVVAQSVAFDKGKKLEVMTQNLYVGADLARLLAPEAGNPFCDPVPTPLCVPATVAGIMETIFANDFHERAATLAERIKTEKPDLIGLQEVSLLRRESPGDFVANGLVDADEVLLDFLEILLDALDDVGISYQVAAMVENADIELPWLVGFDGATPLLDDARLTDRDVILVRSNVDTANADAENYTNNLPITVGGVTVEFTRGYCAVDATVRGVTYRFVNTHLEIEEDTVGGFFQTAQATELIAVLATETLPVVLVGDFNSSPDDAPDHPYGLLTGSHYVDLWTRRDVPELGFTCCQEEDLRNSESVLYERVDLILARNDAGFLPFSSVGPVKSIETIGDSDGDQTPSGMWPSDHAGVHAELRIPELTVSEP